MEQSQRERAGPRAIAPTAAASEAAGEGGVATEALVVGGAGVAADAVSCGGAESPAAPVVFDGVVVVMK